MTKQEAKFALEDSARWNLVYDPEQDKYSIEDVEHNLRFCILCGSGFGQSSDSILLAKRIVGFLNQLDPKLTLLYPYNKS
jgi:hypothetical protein